MSRLPLGRRRAGLPARRPIRRPSVEHLEPKQLLATFVVTSNADAGAGTLRDAITQANQSAGLDSVQFNLPAGRKTITLSSQLPAIVDPITIDGTTDPAYQGAPVVEVAGATGTQTGSGDGFRILSGGGGSTIRGLAINRFSGNGITINDNDNVAITDADNNRIQSNFIGIGTDGTSDFGNDGHGILIQSSSGNVIGGESSRGNIIFNNGRDTDFNGITIDVNPGGRQSNNNRILYNAIGFSGGLGIDLGGDGVTANDPAPDGDTGPNTLQNFPVVTSAVTIQPLFGASSTVITATLTSRPNTTYQVEYFESEGGANRSGFGEGPLPVLVRQVTTDADGVATFTDTLTGRSLLTAGNFLSMTATDPDGNTSEFSRAEQIQSLSSFVDVGITVTDSPDPVAAGQILSYDVIVRNNNFQTPSGQVVAEVVLPESVTVVDPGLFVQDPTNPNLYRANFGQLQGGASGATTLQVIPSQAGILQATFSVSGGIADPQPGNDQATATTQVTLDPGTPVLSFRVRDYAVSESGGLATVEVVRTNSAAGTVTVDFATVDGSAVSGTNYVTSAGTLTFGNNETSKVFVVSILDNDTIDPNRTVGLLLRNPTNGAVVGVPSRATLTIFDDDPATPEPQFIEFSQSNFPALENQGQATVVVRRTGGTSGVVSIPFATAPGSALADRDYTPISGTLTFNSGESEKTITVPIADNAAADGNRSFSVVLGAGTGAAAGQQRRAEVTIVDDETPPAGVFQFASANFTAVESDGRATIAVTRTGGLGPATVTFATVPGTAQPGVRYQPTSGTLEFGPGETQKAFTVELIDTPGFIGPQTVLLELGVASGAGLGQVSRATLTILDDEPAPASVFQFESSTVVVDESAGVARLTVNRLGGTFGASQVSVATFGGDAVPGADYQPVAVRLTFAPGETSKTVEIPIIDNDAFDGDRGVAVFLGFPEGNATIGNPGATALVIRNNDLDPDPPTVVDVQAGGFGGAISNIALAFDKAIAGATALAPSNYSVVALGRDGVFGTADDRAIPIAGIGQSPDGRGITIALASPVPAGQFVALGVNGGPGGLAGVSGGLIDGDDDGTAGGNFSTTLARSSRLTYRDADGDVVTLAAFGGGVVEVVRGAPGTGDIVRVVDAVPNRTVLRGQVSRRRGSDGVALIRRIEGIDPFGRVRSALRTPPFVDLSQIAPAAVDALLASQARRNRS